MAIAIPDLSTEVDMFAERFPLSFYKSRLDDVRWDIVSKYFTWYFHVIRDICLLSDKQVLTTLTVRGSTLDVRIWRL